MTFIKTPTIIIAAIIAMMAAISCSGRDHGEQERQRFSQAQEAARHWAAKLVNTSRQDTAAMQMCILEAKAEQTRLVANADDDIADDLNYEFEKAYQSYIEENAPDLANELF